MLQSTASDRFNNPNNAMINYTSSERDSSSFAAQTSSERHGVGMTPHHNGTMHSQTSAANFGHLAITAMNTYSSGYPHQQHHQRTDLAQ